MQEDSVNNKIALFISIAILLVAVIVISAKVLNSLNSDTTETTPSASTATSDENSAPPIQPIYDVDPNAVAAITPPVAIQPSLPAPESSAVAAQVLSPAQAPETAATPAAPVVAEEEFPPSPGKPVEVIIETKKEIEIFYAKGNTRQFKSLKLPQNHLQIIKSASGLHIKSSDGGAFKVVVNGIDRGLAGANNKQVKLSF